MKTLLNLSEMYNIYSTYQFSVVLNIQEQFLINNYQREFNELYVHENKYLNNIKQAIQ